MAKYLIEVKVDEDKLYDAVGGIRHQFNIQDGIVQEMGWLNASGIYLTSVTEIPEDEIDIPDIKHLGEMITDIINQDGEEKTDGQCLDEIIDLLDKYGLYKKRV